MNYRSAVGFAILMLAASIPLRAQDRMPPIPVAKLSDAQKHAVEDFKAARHTDISGPFVPLLRSPEVMTRARAMGDYLRCRSVLPPRLREFVILMTSRQCTQQYEWNAHAPLAREGGLSAEIVNAIADGRRPDRMAEDEEVVYAFCDELRRNQSVSDATYALAVARLGEQGVIETIGLMGYYTLLAMVMNTARTPLGEATRMPLAPFPR